MSQRERCAAAVLSELIEPGQLELYALVVEHGAAAALDRLLAAGGPVQLSRTVSTKLGRRDPYVRGAELITQAQRCGARLLTPQDAQWPQQLTDLAALSCDDCTAAPPIALWLRGELSLRDACRRSVSIVGARAATSYGTHATTELAAGLARRGWTVISGAAYGVDGAAHRGALAAEGATVAVLACGVDRAYPAGHARLLQRISETGLVISEWPPASPPLRHRFLIRNRVIAALGRGVVVTEAARRSGSRVTARRAQELGRPVMALPGPVTSAMSVGPHELIRDWQATLVTSAADVIAEVGSLSDVFAEQAEFGHADACNDPESQHARLLKAFPARQAASVEQLAAACQMTPRQVRGILPDLIMRRLIVDHPAGFARTTPS